MIHIHNTFTQASPQFQMNFTLNDTQQKVLEEVSEVEIRSVEQMVSLLLKEGVRFYFCDYSSPFYNEIDADKLEDQLLADAKSKTETKN